MRIYTALYYKLLISKALRYGPCVTCEFISVIDLEKLFHMALCLLGYQFLVCYS